MSEPRPPQAGASVPRRLAVGVLLVLVGLVFWALYALLSGGERHSYAALANPPKYVRLVAGHQYWISVHGGVRREAELGVSPGALQCTAAGQGQAAVALSVTAERSDTKAIDQIASFTPEFSGYVQVQCQGIGLVYVDDAADAPRDWAGTWLLFASLSLAVGLPLTLSGIRGVRRAPADA